MRKTVAILSALLSVGPAVNAAGAQSVGHMLVTDVRNAAGDAWDVWTSPFRAHGRDWLTAAGVVAVSAAVSPIDASVDRWAVRNQNAGALDFLNPVREGGVAFSGRTITPVAVGALAVSLVIKNQTMQDGLISCATAYGASSVVRTFVVYPLIGRTRPDPRDPSGPSPPAQQGDQYHFQFPGSSDWGEHSLPGGHLANITACIESLTHRYKMGIVEPVLWTAVGGVAIARTLDRGHWTSDEVLGAFFGFAVGREVALRSLRRAARAKQATPVRVNAEPQHSDSLPRDDDLGALYVAPAQDGVHIGWRRQF